MLVGSESGQAVGVEGYTVDWWGLLERLRLRWKSSVSAMAPFVKDSSPLLALDCLSSGTLPLGPYVLSTPLCQWPNALLPPHDSSSPIPDRGVAAHEILEPQNAERAISNKETSILEPHRRASWCSGYSCLSTKKRATNGQSLDERGFLCPRDGP